MQNLRTVSLTPAGTDGTSGADLLNSMESDDIKTLLSSSHHSLKQSQLRKGEVCVVCNKVFGNFFLNQGYKCLGNDQNQIYFSLLVNYCH